MKNKLFLLLLLVFTVYNSNAQISIGRTNRGQFVDFKKGTYELLKKKTTVFIADQIDRTDFELAAQDAWKFNSYIVLTRTEFQQNKEKYISDDYMIWSIDGLAIETSKSSYLYVYINCYYPTDIKPKKNKKTKEYQLDYTKNMVASVFLAGNTGAMWEMMRNLKFDSLEDDLYNYRLGYIKNYMQFISTTLEQKGYAFVYGKDYDKKNIKALKKATLYIPDYFKIKSNWGWSDEERENPNELFKDYKFKYEFIDNEALQDKILEAEEDFYYMTYTRVNSQKLITIVNGKTGDIIYRDYQTMSYQLKPKDLKAISKAINGK